MNSFIYCGAKNKSHPLMILEKTIICNLTSIMNGDNSTEGESLDLSKHIEAYTYLICHDCEIFEETKIESMKNILKFMLKYPVENKIDASIVEALCEEYMILNKLTIGISQLTSNEFEPKLMDGFIKYVKGTKIEKLAVIFLFRINNSHIKKNYFFEDMILLTSKELYYCITTGYYAFNNFAGTAIQKLKDMAAINELDLLKKAGFPV